MMRGTATCIVALIFAALIVGRPHADQSGIVYVELNLDRLRQEKDRAQREWQRANPDLEAHLGTARKDQVLDEIEQSRAAAAKFSDLEQKYYASRQQALADQMKAFQPTRVVGSPGDLTKQMIATMETIRQNLADDRQSLKSRLDQLDQLKLARPLTKEEVLVREQLYQEWNQVRAEHDKLDDEKRKLESNPPAQEKDVETVRAGLADTLRLIQADTQRQRDAAKYGAELFESYYRNLRAAVESRPADPAPLATVSRSTSPTSSTLKTDFRGTWVAPDGNLPLMNACPLRSAEMSLKLRGSQIEGLLTLKYGADAGGSACPSFMTGPFYEVTLSLNSGRPKDSSVSLIFSGAANPGGTPVMKLKGMVDVRLINDYQAQVSLEEQDRVLPSFQARQFRRIPEILAAPPAVRTPDRKR